MVPTNTGTYGDTYLARPIELHPGMAVGMPTSNAVQVLSRRNVVEAYDHRPKVEGAEQVQHEVNHQRSNFQGWTASRDSVGA